MRLWIPHQHGAWAMLAVPLLLGAVAVGPGPLHGVLAVAAVAGYLAVATAQAWRRARNEAARAPLVRSLALDLALLAVTGLPLLVVEPRVALAGAIALPGVALALGGSRPGARRELGDSLGQASIAVALVPAAALVGPGGPGAIDPPTLAVAVGTAVAYLVGTILVVRSVIRERENVAFARVSVGWHLAAAIVASFVASPVLAVAALALTARAAALPALRRRRMGEGRQLRPAVVGMVELAGSIVLVVAAFAGSLRPGGILFGA